MTLRDILDDLVRNWKEKLKWPQRKGVVL